MTTNSQPPKKYQRNLFSPESLLKKIDGYFPESLLLSIIVWLCQEITKHGGSPSHLDPKGSDNKGFAYLKLKSSHYNKWMVAVIKHALQELPKKTQGPAAKSAAAMRKILKKWGTKYQAFQCLSSEHQTEHPDLRYPGIEKLELMREMTLTLSLNPSHPKATRIHAVDFYLTGHGQADFYMTIKYARDGSSWDYSSREDGWYLRQREKTIEAEFVDALAPLKEESPEETLARLYRHVLQNTEQGLPPDNWNMGQSYWAKHQRHINTEETYRKIESVRCGLGFGSGELTPDAETKAKFGCEGSPYFIYEEVASMLADLTHDSNIQDCELHILAKGLRTMRRKGKVARAFAAFLKSANREDHSRFDRHPLPCDQKLLQEALTLLKANKDTSVGIRIPKNEPNTGLRLVPLKSIQIYPKTNKFRVKGEKNSMRPISEIREFVIS